MEEDAGVNCLFCYSSIDTTKPGGVESVGVSTHEALEVTFVELCSLLHISFPSKWNSWDFEHEPFPFCNQCHVEIATVCDLSDQVKLIQKSLDSILLHLTATALQSVHPGKENNSVNKIGGGLSLPQHRTVPGNKYEFFRESVIKSYTPALILRPLKETATSRSSIRPFTVNSHYKTAVAEHDDSDGSYCVDSEPFDDVPDFFEPVTVKVEDALAVLDNSISCLEEEPTKEPEITTTKKRTRRPEKVEIELVDEATSTFSFSGFKFQEVNDNFKCLTCSKVCAFPKDQKIGSNTYFKYIRLHITRTHIGPKTPATAPFSKKAIDTTDKLTPARRGKNQSTSYVPILPRMSNPYLDVKSEANENHSEVSVEQVNDKKKDGHTVSASVAAISEDVHQTVDDETDDFGIIEDTEVLTTERFREIKGNSSNFKLLNEDTKTYSMEGYKFQELEDTFKCLTCGKVLKALLVKGNGKRRFQSIRRHVRYLHIDTQKAPITTIVGEDTKTYLRAYNFWKGFEASTPSAPKTDGGEIKLGAERSFVNSSLLEPQPAVKQELFSSAGNFVIRPDCGLEVLDESQKIFSLYECKFRELAQGYECGTCFKILGFGVGETKRRRKLGIYATRLVPRLTHIKKHIIELHVDPSRRAKGPSTLVDSSANIYDYQGFQFQGKNRQYRCLKCKELGSSSAQEVYERVASVQRHIWKDHKRADKLPARIWLVHEQMKLYTYKQCEFVDSGEGGHECVICKAVRHTWAAMVDHIDQEHKEPVERQCILCPWKYKTATGIRVHIKYSHTEDRTKPVCETCGRSFMNQKYLNKHVKQMHRERTHTCGQCDKKFTVAAQLRNHILSIHEGVRSCVCEVCGKGFYNASLLKFHQQIHASEKAHICDQCGKAFAQGTCLTKHIRSVHQGHKRPHKYPCDICGKKYQSNFAVKTHHREVHLRIRPKRVRDSRTKKTIRSIQPEQSLEESRNDSSNSIW